MRGDDTMFTLPELTYEYTALEPIIDAKTMEIHHSKHHAAYVANANAALEGTVFADLDVTEVLARIHEVPEEKRQAVINNAGGHANHSLFWTLLSKNQGTCSEELTKAITETFGSFEAFKEAFTKAGMTRFGSGWAFLVVTPEKKLEVISRPNQDSPLMDGLTPILALDVWEHAYYLNYQNRRPDYISAFFDVVNWDVVSKLYADAL